MDRIGQKSEKILCYSFLPADGVERIIRLRNRVRQRLTENAEVVGSDEAFFEDDASTSAILDLYNEKSGILDGDEDGEIDLASYAYQIWKEAIERDPSLAKTIPDMPSVVYSTQPHVPTPSRPEGVLVYMRSPADNDALVWIDREGKAVGARFRTYERLKKYASEFDSLELQRTIDEIYRYPLQQSATDQLNRQMKNSNDTQQLAQLCHGLARRKPPPPDPGRNHHTRTAHNLLPRPCTCNCIRN